MWVFILLSCNLPNIGNVAVCRIYCGTSSNPKCFYPRSAEQQCYIILLILFIYANRNTIQIICVTMCNNCIILHTWWWLYSVNLLHVAVIKDSLSIPRLIVVEFSWNPWLAVSLSVSLFLARWSGKSWRVRSRWGRKQRGPKRRWRGDSFSSKMKPDWPMRHWWGRDFLQYPVT